MKIAIDARIISTSTGRYIERLLEYLQDLDHDNQYIVLVRRDDLDFWHPKVPNFKLEVADHPPYTLREQLGLAWRLYRLKPDLVHFAMPQHPLLYRGRYVITIHDLTLIRFVNRRATSWLRGFYKHSLKPAVFQLVLRHGAQRAAHIITPTEYVRQDVITELRVKPGQVSFTHESADLLATQGKAVRSLGNQRFLLYVGNAYPYKNLRRLIDAFAQLSDPKLRLVLAGKPDFFYAELEDYVRERSIANVVFSGFVSDAELRWLYEHAKLYVFPSLSEGFGLPGLEAMAHGLPVVASDATCIPEVLGDAAVYFDPMSTGDLSETIRETLAHPSKLTSMKTAGLARAKQFSWKRMAEQTLAIYKDALKS